MEMVFCFCQNCLDEIDRLYREGETLPAYLNAYSGQLCANCGRKLKIVGTRKFEVELLNVQEQDGVHQYTEFSVLRYIPEPSQNYLLVISCSQRKIETPGVLPAIERYDGPVYRCLRKFRDAQADATFPNNLRILILSAEYGLIMPETEIPTYDHELFADDAKSVAEDVQADLRRCMVFYEMAYGGTDEVFLNLGKAYMQTLDRFRWDEKRTNILTPSGGIGQKVSQMKAWLERIAEASLSKGGVRE